MEGNLGNMTWNLGSAINRMWAFVQTGSMFSWVTMDVNESHWWCEWGGLERVWARRLQIPWVHNLRAEEDAVERERTGSDGPVGGYPDNANPKAESQGGDGMTLTRLWTLQLGGEDRQALILHFQTWALWCFPGEGVPHTIYGLHYVIWIALT